MTLSSPRAGYARVLVAERPSTGQDIGTRARPNIPHSIDAPKCRHGHDEPEHAQFTVSRAISARTQQNGVHASKSASIRPDAGASSSMRIHSDAVDCRNDDHWLAGTSGRRLVNCATPLVLALFVLAVLGFTVIWWFTVLVVMIAGGVAGVIFCCFIEPGSLRADSQHNGGTVD